MTGRLEAALIELAAAIREELSEAASAAPERLYDIPSAAATMGIGRTRLYAELDAGRLRSVKVGRRRLVPASAIAERIGATTQKAAGARTPTATADAARVAAVRNAKDTADDPRRSRRPRAA